MRFFDQVKVSVKSVFFNYKRYLCFFVVLFIIETLISAVITLNVNNTTNQLDYLESRYNYHVQLQNLDQSQYYYIVNIKEPENSETFELVHGVRHTIAGTNTYRYDLDIRFYENVSSNYASFVSNYYQRILNAGENEFKEFQTPLLKYNVSIAGNTAVCVLTCLFIFASGCVIVYLLDNIMVNHYKFIYGVYMTYGANFKKLFVNSISETVLISLIVYIPSQIVANLACMLIAFSSGLSFRPSAIAILLALISGVIISGVAVFINIKKVSRKTPLKLISAVDNSNIITSPRVSSEFFGYTFPRSSELLSLRRFAKYIAGLIASTVAFSVVFLCCVYLGNVYSKTLSHKDPEFTLTFAGNVYEEENDNGDIVQLANYQYLYDDDIRDYLYTFDGIDIILKSCDTEAIDINSNVKIANQNVKSVGKGIDTGDGYRAFLNADYRVIDEDIAGQFEYFGYGISGDIEEVLSGRSTVAITDGFNNSSKFKFSVGDKILVATARKRTSATKASDSSDIDNLLASYLNSFEYTYTEFTVGAIIKDIPVADSFGIYFCPLDYMLVTNRQPIFDKVDIVTDQDITDEQYNDLITYLRAACDYYTNMEFVNNDAELVRQVEKNKNYQSVFIFISIMLLIVTPLIWFFSQILFYLKRRPEFDVYFSLGAPGASVKKLFLIDSSVLFVISAVIFTILSFAAVGIITSFINSTFYAASAYMRFGFDFPFVGYIVGLAVLALCSFFGSYIPYKMYIKSCHPVFTGRAGSEENEIISEGETGL